MKYPNWETMSEKEKLKIILSLGFEKDFSDLTHKDLENIVVFASCFLIGFLTVMNENPELNNTWQLLSKQMEESAR